MTTRIEACKAYEASRLEEEAENEESADTPYDPMRVANLSNEIIERCRNINSEPDDDELEAGK